MLERARGDLARAAATAALLLERDAAPPERARRLREAASIDAALGNVEQAKERLRAALEVDPLEHETIAGLTALLASEGNDRDAKEILTKTLPGLPPATPQNAPARAALWVRLGETRERTKDAKGALQAFEKALELDPSRRPLREALLERYGEDTANDPTVRPH